MTGARRKAKRSGERVEEPRSNYQPERGDFVYLDFTPHSGTEQAGRRPALVLSPQAFNISTGLVFTCPITSRDKGGAFDVPVPHGARLTGFILSHQMRALDWSARNATFHSRAPELTVLEVLARIEAILQIELDPS